MASTPIWPRRRKIPPIDGPLRYPKITPLLISVARSLARIFTRAYGKPELPRLLKWRQQQLGPAMATATQMNRRALELEKFVEKRLKDAYREHERLKGEPAPVYPILLAMQPDEYQPGRTFTHWNVS
jgi:hypothetical protein